MYKDYMLISCHFTYSYRLLDTSFFPKESGRSNEPYFIIFSLSLLSQSWILEHTGTLYSIKSNYVIKVKTKGTNRIVKNPTQGIAMHVPHRLVHAQEALRRSQHKAWLRDWMGKMLYFIIKLSWKRECLPFISIKSNDYKNSPELNLQSTITTKISMLKALITQLWQNVI